MANKIIISRAFAKELSEHSRPVQKAVNEVYGKLMRDEGVNGLNLETIKGAASSAIKSVRVNNNYRVVLHQDKKGNFEASCITVGLFDTDSGVKRCEHGARSAECLQRAA